MRTSPVATGRNGDRSSAWEVIPDHHFGGCLTSRGDLAGHHLVRSSSPFLASATSMRYAVCGKEMPAACSAPGAPPPRPTALQPFETDMTRRSGVWRTFMCGSGADAMPRTAPFMCGAVVRDRGVAPAMAQHDSPR